MHVETPQALVQQIYHQAIRYLSYREYAIDELRLKLHKKFDSEREITQVIDRLLHEDLLCEHRYAESYIRARVNKGFGPLHIFRELLNRGIKKNIVDKALNESEIVWADEIFKVWNKKYKHLPVDDPQDKMLQWRFLQYRGFSHEQIKDLFSRLN